MPALPPAAAVVSAQLVTVAGQRRALELPASASGDQLYAAAAAALALQPGRFKLLLRGVLVSPGGAAAGVTDG
ncbi:hypothetical protein MNEG_15679, partial [Monoraphidium neglectum]